MKKCPYCAEEIQDEAIKCKYCGEMLIENGRIDSIRGSLKEAKLKCHECGTENEPNAFRCKNQDCLSILTSDSKGKFVPVQYKNVFLKCPRCGYEGDNKEFSSAYSDLTCCLLACLMLLPAILYYFFRSRKKVCPKCKNIF